MDARVADELQRALPSGTNVYVLGGELAISSTVATQIAALGYNVVRYGGSNRYATAVAIADQGLQNPTTIMEVTGSAFPDALAGGAAAAAKSAAVLLTSGSNLPTETTAYLAQHPADTRFAIGGPASQADPSATAVVGPTRYETAVAVARAFFSTPTDLGGASGVTYPDALSGGPHIGLKHGPLLLLPQSGGLPAAVTTYLHDRARSTTSVWIYGGTLAVGDDVSQEVQQAITPPA